MSYSYSVLPFVSFDYIVILLVMKQPSEISSGAAQALATEVKLVMEGPLVESPSKRKLVFRPIYFEMAQFGPWMGPLRPKIGPCRADMDPPLNVNCLFSFNVDGEKLQYLIVRSKNGSPGSERRNSTPFTPLAVPLEISNKIFACVSLSV